MDRWLDDRRDDGWLAEAEHVSVTGFPLTYVRRLDQPALADPAAGWAWQAAWLTIARPRHPQITESGWQIAFPEEQQVQTPWQSLLVEGGQIAARVSPTGSDGRLSSAALDLQDVELRSDAGWNTSIETARLSATADAGEAERLKVKIAATGIVPPTSLARSLADIRLSPDRIERLELDADVDFDRPWDLAILENGRPQPRRIAVRDAGVRWGELTLRFAGTLDVDDDGRPSGEVLVKATNWREILAAGIGSGAVPEGVGRTIEGALELASRLAGSPSTLDIPVRFDEGRVRLGPVPVGRVPNLRIP